MPCCPHQAPSNLDEMANFVKPKLAVSFSCIALLVLIRMLETNFNAPVNTKRWGEPLTWEDFTGIPPIFSKYDAAINSSIYLEYDSTNSSYHAYAAQFDRYSWTRSREDSSYLLNHEQYHFNITELHARMMNDYIKKNPKKNEFDLQMQLATLKGELRFMQDLYDDETDHSTITNKQRRWEYNIDSLLQSYSPDSGLVRDNFSGAKVYFASPPTFNSGINSNEVPFRQYILSRYGMELLLISFQDPTYRNINLAEFIRDHYKRLGITIKFQLVTEQNGKTRVSVITRDSSNMSYHGLWLRDGSNLIRLLAKFTTRTPDTTGYFQIARSFINSFELTEANQYWLNEIENDTETTVTVSSIFRAKPEARENCLFVKENQSVGFYKSPLYNKQGTLLIPFDALRHADSIVNEKFLLIDKEIYTYSSKSNEIIYSLPLERQPTKTYTINLGYTIKNDSSKCKLFYNQAIEIDPLDRPLIKE